MWNYLQRMAYCILFLISFGLVSCHPRGFTSSAISNNIPVALPSVTSKLDTGAKATFYFTPEVTQARDNFQAAYNYLSQLSHLAPDDPVWPSDATANGIPLHQLNPINSHGAESSSPGVNSISPGSQSSLTQEATGISSHPENKSTFLGEESVSKPKVELTNTSDIVKNETNSNNKNTEVSPTIMSTVNLDQPITISELQESGSRVSSLIALSCNIIDPTQDLASHTSNRSIVIKTTPQVIGMNFDNVESTVTPPVITVESTSSAPALTSHSSPQDIIITIPTTTPRLLKNELPILEDAMFQTTSQQPPPLESTSISTILPVTPRSHLPTNHPPPFESATKIIRMKIPKTPVTPKIRMKMSPESRTSTKLDRIAEESVNTLSPVTTSIVQAPFSPTTPLPSTEAIHLKVKDIATSTTTNNPTLANPPILTTTNAPSTTIFPEGYEYGGFTPEVAQATANFFRQYLIDTVRNGDVSQGRLVLRKR